MDSNKDGYFREEGNIYNMGIIMRIKSYKIDEYAEKSRKEGNCEIVEPAGLHNSMIGNVVNGNANGNSIHYMFIRI